MAGGTQWQGTYLENLRDFVDAFNDGKLGEAAQDLNVTIELDVVTDMSSTYPTRLRSESRYPHLMLFDRFNTPEYAENDFILDLNDYLEEREIDTSLFTSAAMTEMVYDGATYGLPSTSTSGAFMSIWIWWRLTTLIRTMPTTLF